LLHKLYINGHNLDRVSEKTPKAFIWHTFEDEAVPVQNSLIFSKQLADNGVCFEMHIYPHGPHGLALCNEETALGRPHYIRPECEGWIIDACRWMNSF
jgi:endo-1,4-beta-xylanase